MKLLYLLFITCACISCNGTKYFFNPNKNIKPIVLKGVHIEHNSFVDSEKKKISYMKVMPVKNNGINYSILFIPPNGGNSSLLIQLMQPIIDFGISFYMFDYQGYGKSSGSPNNKNVLLDAQMMLDIALKDVRIEHKKLILWGYSLGGNLAVKLAYENQDSIVGLVLEGAFSSFRDIAHEKLPKGFNWLSIFINSPYPSKKYIKKIIEVPIIISHSLNDKVCPFKMGKLLFENSQQPKLFIKLDGKHCLGLLDETNYINRIINFIDNYEKKQL